MGHVVGLYCSSMFHQKGSKNIRKYIIIKFIWNQHRKCTRIRKKQAQFWPSDFWDNLIMFSRMRHLKFSTYTINLCVEIVVLRPVNRFTKCSKFHKCYISWSYLESAWKIHQNEYKQAYVWSSGSWDSLWYFHNQDIFFKIETCSLKDIGSSGLHSTLLRCWN